MSVLSALLSPALGSSDPTLLKGAYEALAVSAEGCSDHIRKKYLITFLKYLDTGIKHQIPAVRNAALYALGKIFFTIVHKIYEKFNNEHLLTSKKFVEM